MIELSWKQFRELPNIKRLNENQIQMEYSLYLQVLSTQVNPKGRSSKDQTQPIQTYTGFLLQENGDYIFQEDGSKIFL